MSDNYEIQYIEQALINDRNTKLVITLLILLFSVWAIDYNFKHYSWFMTIVCLVAVFTSIRLFANVIRYWKVNRMPLMFLLNNKPTAIVWVYSVVTVRLPFGVQWARKGTMYFKLEDGDDITIRLLENDIPRVAKYLNKRLPHATFGYSDERAQWYMANPLLLIRDDYEE